jgi:hypothetical protein
VNSALGPFEANGVDAATVEQIATTVDVSRATFFPVLLPVGAAEGHRLRVAPVRAATARG